jgi:hypothetical protein
MGLELSIEYLNRFDYFFAPRWKLCLLSSPALFPQGLLFENSLHRLPSLNPSPKETLITCRTSWKNCHYSAIWNKNRHKLFGRIVLMAFNALKSRGFYLGIPGMVLAAKYIQPWLHPYTTQQNPPLLTLPKG